MRTRNLRLAIIVLGMIMIFCSLAALAYSLWPVDLLIEQTPLSPILFLPP